ncbi:uncharacterized protein LOC123516691 [Portunus trituberculatus]|uniref:uncharacterized protein LOC123516691 n=1 Tax=Portunus trituberculatus TaxID=210409 RepID=UPI001E1D15E7|nr:uncharacterized protein LOC123516691 [Portunus trituberculatus]
MGEVRKLVRVKLLFTTPCHPSGNGRVGRMHSTLKACLRKLCSEKPREWLRYLPATLFALREMPSDRTGFSSFELLYGKADDDRSCFQYVIELKDKLAESSRIAAENAAISVARYKAYFAFKSQKSQDRKFKSGDEVLVLLPDTTYSLLMGWAGPYSVLEKRTSCSYLIDENEADTNLNFSPLEEGVTENLQISFQYRLTAAEM